VPVSVEEDVLMLVDFVSIGLRSFEGLLVDRRVDDGSANRGLIISIHR